MTVRDRIRAAISDSYYDARNDGLTMEHAADQATAKVLVIFNDRVDELRKEHAEDLRDAGAEMRDLQSELNAAQRAAEGW